ncbi:hypothetical protein Zmor_022932 [Zophobas morio]|uniref:Cytochrome P450 n=1 Tax=Zophobas morio TaxID=2755281 RepID=A0AA38M6T8_9CUCU|nr:hypothetical protein Zmor_022932 [Zophobas morio]
MLEIILGIILGALIYYSLIKPTSFWEERGVTHEPSWPIIGNMAPFVLRKQHFSGVTTALYNKFPNHRYIGYHQFTTPALLIRDLELIKQIGVKDFDNFHDHMSFATNDIDPLLSKSLINLLGDQWKQMRATLSPAFTSSKMRTMFHLMAECAENFTHHFKNKEQVDVEMKDLFSRFANDVIATIAFGIQVNSVEDPKHEFYVMGNKITQFDAKQVLKIFLFQTVPKLAKMLNITMLRQDVASFFRSLIMNNIDKRVKEKIVRPDLIQLLLEAQKGKLKHEHTVDDVKEGFATVEESHIGRNTKQMVLTDEHIVAQALLFFFAGFETVSNASSLMAHELAVNPDVQKKLQEEIDDVRQQYGEKVPYEALLSMKYLDQVVSETLRLWPPAFQTDRCCNRNYTIHPKNPNERALVVEKYMITIIPIMAIQRDPEYYPNPERFDPERFNDENKAKIVPGTYMPFGIGPRNCIGSRFALLEIKTLFFHLLSKFDLVPTEKTEIPLRLSPKKANMSPENGFHLGLKPRKL